MEPKAIDPASIGIGDTIMIVLPRNQGIIHTIEGTVAKIEVSGGVRYYLTQQGGNLLAYYPGIKDIRVLLISREDKSQATIFRPDFWKENNDDVFDGLSDRIAQ